MGGTPPRRLSTSGIQSLSADTDGDGIDDLSEVALGTDPLDPSSVPPADTFCFVLPFEDEDGPTTQDFEFETTPVMADVFFLIDTTGSMAEALGFYSAPFIADPTTPGGGIIGGAGFRAESQPIFILITDAPFHNDLSSNDPYDGVTLGAGTPNVTYAQALGSSPSPPA